MSPPRSCLIPSPPPPTAATLPPKHPIPPPLNLPLRRLMSTVSRRDALALSLLSLLHRPPPATAFSIGISGPKDWLREQKKKSANFLLAPIDGSRNILRAAYLLLMMKDDSEYGEKDVEEVQGMLRSASRDCVPKERNSFVNFQAKTGVEVCTFQLVLKNAASLLDNDDPIKLEAEASLRDLVRNDLMDANEVADKLARMDVAQDSPMLSMSFTSLNVVANEIDTQIPSSRQKVAEALMDSISSLNNFEQGVKDCLEI